MADIIFLLFQCTGCQFVSKSNSRCWFLPLMHSLVRVSASEPRMTCSNSSKLNSLVSHLQIKSWQTEDSIICSYNVLWTIREWLSYPFFLKHDLWAELPATPLECTLGIQSLTTFHHIGTGYLRDCLFPPQLHLSVPDVIGMGSDPTEELQMLYNPSANYIWQHPGGRPFLPQCP